MAESLPSRSLHVEALYWKDETARGADLYYHERAYRRGLRRLVRLQWPPTIQDGWSRFAWTVIDTVEPVESKPTVVPPKKLLFVIVAPEVEVLPEIPVKSSMAEVPQPPPPCELNIVRVQRADYVPQPDEPIRIGSILPADTRVDASSIFAGKSDWAGMRWVADGAIISHSHEDWQVRIKVDPYKPSAWGLLLLPGPMAHAVIARSSFEVAIVTTGPVDVEVSQLSTVFPIGVLPGFRMEEHSQVSVERGDSTVLQPVPRTGLDLSMARSLTPVDAKYRYPEWQESLLTALYVTVEVASLLPVLGTFIDVGQFVYAASNGRNIWGEKVTERDLILMGVFATVGLVADVGPVLLKSVKIAAKLFPLAKMVLPNPGFAVAVKSILRLHNTPHVAHALSHVPDADALRLLAAVDDALTSPMKMGALLKVVDDVLSPLLRQMDSLGDMPVPLFAHVMGSTHPERLASFAALTPAARKLVVEAFNDAARLADPTVLKRALSSSAWDEYEDLVREAAVRRVFNPAMDGFRSAALDDSLYRGLLAEGFDLYAKRKASKDLVARTAIDWASKQTSSSRYYSMLVAELGPDFAKLLSPFVKKVKYAVDQPAATFYEAAVTRQGTYAELRKFVSKAGEKAGVDLGALFEVDHLLEKRFLNYFDEFGMPDEEFLSILVPKNTLVADGLLSRGVKAFPYVHATKTARFKQLLPYGSEGYFTVQEMYNAYRLVLVHEFGMGEAAFKGLMDDTFLHLLESARLSAADSELLANSRVVEALTQDLDMGAKTAEELLASVMKVHALLE